MFSTEHFIWLGAGVVIIIVTLLINKKYQLSLKANLNLMTVVLFLSETIKTMSGIQYFEEYGGYYLSPGCLPFHLCSLQIFFILYLRFVCKKEKVRDQLLCFMFPTMLLGGLAALLIPTAGTDFTQIGPYQYFGYHIFIVYFAIYLVTNRVIVIDFKVVFRNIVYMGLLVVCNIWVNSMLSYQGVNFMFLANPPMEGLPILNTNHGWYVYFLHLLSLGLILMLGLQVPIALHNRNREKQLAKK